jgi:hypothetical protein
LTTDRVLRFARSVPGSLASPWDSSIAILLSCLEMYMSSTQFSRFVDQMDRRRKAPRACKSDILSLISQQRDCTVLLKETFASPADQIDQPN